MSVNFDNDPEFSDAVPKPRTRRGFRLRELMVVVAIFAVLIAFLLPASRTARPAAYRAQCQSNLKNVVLALRNYEAVHGALPPAYTADAQGRPLHSWRTLILPYIDEQELYEAIDLSKPWYDPANAQALKTRVGVFRCPQAVGPPNTTTFLAIAGPNGCLIPGRPRRLAEITDAHASTLMVIEAGDENAVPWMAPVDADESLVMSLGPTSKLHHAGGTNVAFVDGGVRYLKADIPDKVRRALMSISGNDNNFAIDW